MKHKVKRRVKNVEKKVGNIWKIVKVPKGGERKIGKSNILRQNDL